MLTTRILRVQSPKVLFVELQKQRIRAWSRTPATKKPRWVKDLEADADVDPGAAKVLEGTGGNPELVLENIRKEQKKKLETEDLVQPRTGVEAPVNVRFREIDPENLWIWFEFYSAPSVTDSELLSEVMKSWFMIGKLGGFNSANLQISYGAADNINFFHYDKERGMSTLDSFLHEITNLETNDLWARIKVDMGTCDELCLDVLINMVLTFSKEYVGIKNMYIGGVNKDWPITAKEFIPDPFMDNELEQKVKALAKDLGKNKDDHELSTSIDGLFEEEDEEDYSLNDLIGDEVDLNDDLFVKRIRKKYVSLEKHSDKITFLCLKNEKNRNCINVQFLEELNFLLSELSEQWSLRSVILKSTVPGCFSSGLDLEEYPTWSDEEMNYVASKTREVYLKLMKFPIPTIALLDGVAVGSGAELALCCDFRIGSLNALFSFPETRLGLIPTGAATQRLPKLIGRTKAKELIFTGRTVSSKEALAIGLLDYLHEENFESKAMGLAREISNGAPLALRAAKRAIEDASDFPVDDSIEKDNEFLRMLIPREDRKEGIRALMEKRNPNYKGH